MVELVDTTDLKSVAFLRPGSIPGVRTNKHEEVSMTTLFLILGTPLILHIARSYKQ